MFARNMFVILFLFSPLTRCVWGCVMGEIRLIFNPRSTLIRFGLLLACVSAFLNKESFLSEVCLRCPV